jgi:cell division protein FtsI/penicillin-binding protein 2
VLAVLATCALGASIVIARLFYVQVLQQEYYRDLALQEHWQKEIIPARRGAIRAADGQPLAVSVSYATLYAVPRRITNPAALANQLAPLLNEPASAITPRLAGTGDVPVAVKAGLPVDVATRIRRLRAPGLMLRFEPRRELPEAPLAAQLIGFVGRDHQGLAGLEASVDNLLAGQPGVVYAERDTGGEEIALGRRTYQPAIDGADVVLTIDRFAQRIVEREVEAAMTKHRAANVTAIVMDPHTGGILAMASRPSYDPRAPNLLTQTDPSLFRVPEVVDIYEPGSVFKVITMAAGIDAGVVTPDTTVYDPGFFSYGGITVHNWDGRARGTITMRQGLAASNNVALATVSTRLGEERFYRYLESFGFGQRTGIELPGEAPGILRTPTNGQPWSKGDLATNAFGQGVAVNSVQLAAAVAAIANGGTLLRPQIIREIWSHSGQETRQPEAVRRVISPEAARTIADMMVNVVESSPSRPAVIEGYRVAGKTGTAELPTARGYSRVQTIATFVGFVPADDPAFVVLIKVERPQDSPWGEVVAAPIFKRIAVPLLAHWRIPPREASQGGGRGRS